jgi:hypothetical protein
MKRAALLPIKHQRLKPKIKYKAAKSPFEDQGKRHEKFFLSLSRLFPYPSPLLPTTLLDIEEPHIACGGLI